MKICTIVGARPQFIKAATVSRVLKKENIEEVLIHTGQHFDANMSDVFFDEMEIQKPRYNLDINGLTHGAMTGQMLEGIEKVLIDEKPDWVIVYGDTNSTIAGALAAKKLHIRVAHIEAGLRSFNMRMPEEVNRILTDNISDVLFCPTETAIRNLTEEGMTGKQVRIANIGDVMYDAALYYSEKAGTIAEQFNKEAFILCTIHRAENTDDLNRMKEIIAALNRLNKEIRIVVPLHPRTTGIIAREGLQCEFTIIDPVGYFDMLSLIKHSRLVITDSGGLQKEAYFFKKFCITLRDETEWVELVETGVNVLTGANSTAILSAYDHFKDRSGEFDGMLYGDGNAAEKIVSILLEQTDQ